MLSFCQVLFSKSRINFDQPLTKPLNRSHIAPQEKTHSSYFFLHELIRSRQMSDLVNQRFIVRITASACQQLTLYLAPDNLYRCSLSL